MLARRRRG
uniref:Uncharacterized protein n=1 Tax=Arundo donax TaxID=35708 RepID=A0A0A9G4F1_ARUDO